MTAGRLRFSTAVMPPATVIADLAAFLRGVEHRAAVFAQLQTGSATRGDQAYAAALHPFRAAALQAAREHWPVLFWSTLLADPHMRQIDPTGDAWHAQVAHLAGVGDGLRAALLLRLAAALGEADAAAVLGISRGDYRQALQRALPHHPDDGRVYETALQALVDGIAADGRALTPERLAHLARVRQAGVQGRHAELVGPWSPEAEPEANWDARPARWMRPTLAGTAVACVLALAATVYWPFGRWNADGSPRVRRIALPDSPPAGRYDAALYLLTHPDFEQLTHTADAPVIDDLAFYAWYAAERAGSGATEPALPALVATPGAQTASTSESADAP